MVITERWVTWRRVLSAAVAVEAALVVAHLAVGLPFGVDRLRVDMEQSLPTWFSSTQFALAAVACLLVAERRWLVIGLLLVAFSVDDAVSTHEQVGGGVGYDLSQQVLQPAAAAVVALGLVLVALREAEWPRRLLLAATLVLIAGQLTATIASATEPDGAVGDALEVAEEWLEMLVGTFLLCAGLARVQRAGSL